MKKKSNNTTNNTTVIYARYSSDRQREESIEGQVRVCREYAEQNGLTVTDIYVDRAISGRTDARPDFQRMIADAKKNLFGNLIVYKTDRFARNKYDAVIYKSQLKKQGIKIHYAAEFIPDTPEGVLLESVMEGYAEFYSLELSQKIKRGIEENVRKGKTIGGPPVLGFKTNEEGFYEVDETTKPLVEYIFREYARGTTVADICKYLNDMGYRTSKGKQFSQSTIPRIISNEKYIGNYLGNEGVLPRIIDQKTFELANERKNKNKRMNTHKAETDYLLSGKVFCGECRSNMVGISCYNRKKKQYFYYACQEQRKHNCDLKPIKKDELEDTVYNACLEFLKTPQTIDYICVKLAEASDQEEEDPMLVTLRKKLAENKKAQENLMKVIEMGTTSTSIPARLEVLEKEEVELDKQVRLLEYKTGSVPVDEFKRLLLGFVENKKNHPKHKEMILKALVSLVIVFHDRIQIIFNTVRNGIDQDTTDVRIRSKMVVHLNADTNIYILRDKIVIELLRKQKA